MHRHKGPRQVVKDKFADALGRLRGPVDLNTGNNMNSNPQENFNPTLFDETLGLLAIGGSIVASPLISPLVEPMGRQRGGGQDGSARR